MVIKQRILIGYDGSECSDAAIQDLRRAGLPRDTEALVLTVAETFPFLPVLPPPPPAAAYALAGDSKENNIELAVRRAHHQADQMLTEAEAIASRGAERVRNAFPTWTVGHTTTADSPYRGIVHRADRWRPDLIVVGSHGRSAWGRTFLGSVAQQVINHAICSVRVARVREGSTVLATAWANIVLAVDGSADSAVAVSAVAGRVWPAGSQVHVIAAIDTRLSALPPFYGAPIAAWTGSQDVSDYRSWAHHAAEGAARELRQVGLETRAVVVEGDPKSVLVEQAERLEADCIFLGAKGHSRLERYLLGSVSSAVAARAHCSVEIVRQG